MDAILAISYASECALQTNESMCSREILFEIEARLVLKEARSGRDRFLGRLASSQLHQTIEHDKIFEITVSFQLSTLEPHSGLSARKRVQCRCGWAGGEFCNRVHERIRG